MNQEARDSGLDRFRQELREEIQTSAAGTRRHFEAVAADMRQHVDAVSAETRDHAEAVEARTRQHVETVAAETRRHFDVVAEGLLSKVQLLAEGLGVLDQKVDRFREEVRDEFSKVDRRFLHLEARMAALEHR